MENCFLCKKRARALFWGCCRRCSALMGNVRQVEEVDRNFKSKSPFNHRVLKLFLADLRPVALKPRHVKMVKRVAEALSSEIFHVPGTWAYARTVSKKLDVRYPKRLELSCPVLRITKELETEGKVALDHPSLRRLEIVLEAFDSKTRKGVEEYLHFAAKDSPYMAHSIARSLRHYHRSLKGGDLFDPNIEQARFYFEGSTSWALATEAEIWVLLNRFYYWSVEKRYSRLNPFENFCPEKLKRTCPKCAIEFYFRRHDQHCPSCAVPVPVQKKFERLVAQYQAASPYNQQLFELYRKHVSLLTITSKHIEMADAFMKYLATASIPAIRSWKEALALSQQFLNSQKQELRAPCPIMTVAKMLEELGVLPIRQIDREIHLEKIYSRCDADTAFALRRYSEHLLRIRCAKRGRYSSVRTVFEFYLWLMDHEPSYALFTASEEVVTRHLLSRRNKDHSGIRRHTLNRFYSWAKFECLTLLNPTEKIPVPKPQRSLLVCSDHQIRLLESYVKKPESDPEYALILTLALYWGLTVLELALSTIEIRDSRELWIYVYRKELGRGRKFYNREQVLKLPLNSPWLAALQTRYILMWRERYEQARKDFPTQPLLLSRARQGRTNRHLHNHSALDLFYEATLAATGTRIPPNVVRRTSGHIHTDHGDASRLTKLGWSKSMATDFSFLPRNYFSSTKK